MASTKIPLSTFQYTINGGEWTQGSGIGISVGRTNAGRVYRGYLAFSLANFGALQVLQNCSLFFHRGDSYGNVSWDIGLRSSKPEKAFTRSDMTIVADGISSTSLADVTVPITAAQLNPFKGGTVYICFLGHGSGYSYGEINVKTSGKEAALTVNYDYAASTISASNGTLGAEQTITVTRQNPSYTHTLTATIGNTTVTIGSEKTTSLSLKWTPAVATYAPVVPNGMSLNCTYRLTTYNGNTAVGTDTKIVTLSIPAASVAPQVSLTISDTMGYADTYGGFIVGRSKFTVVVNPTLKYGATLKNIVAHVNGGTQYETPINTDVVNAGANSMNATITDSRGQTATVANTVQLLTYTSPNLSGVTVYRSTSGGTYDPTGQYLKVNYAWDVSPLNNHNSKSITIRYKKVSEAGYTEIDITPSAYASSDSLVFAADIESSYNIEVVLEDDFSAVTVKTAGSTAAVIFDLFNNGKGMAIGKIAEQNGLDIGWRTTFREWLMVNGGAIQGNGANGRTFQLESLTGNAYLFGGSLAAYDSNSKLRAMISSDGNIRSYDASAREAIGFYPAESQISLYDSSTRTVQIRGDGVDSANPLPVNQGGTGQTTQFPAQRIWTGSATVASATYANLYSFTLPKGYTYMMFGNVGGSVPDSSYYLLCQFIGNTVVGGTGKGTGAGGGGVHCWATVDTTSAAVNVVFRGYHNRAGNTTLNGKVLILQFPAMPEF